jgi:hypothetical protein
VTVNKETQQVCVEQKRTRKEDFHDRDINIYFAILAFSLSIICIMLVRTNQEDRLSK